MSAMTRRVLLNNLDIILAFATSLLLFLYPSWIWFSILLIAIIYRAFRTHKQIKEEKIKERKERALNVAKIIEKRRDEFIENLASDSSDRSIFYVNAPYKSSNKPELWDRYWSCRIDLLQQELYRLDKSLKEAKDTSNIDGLTSCFDRLVSKARSYSVRIEEFHEVFKDIEVSEETRKWFRDVVDENMNFLRKLEEDGRMLSGILGEKIQVTIAFKSLEL